MTSSVDWWENRKNTCDFGIVNKVLIFSLQNNLTVLLRNAYDGMIRADSVDNFDVFVLSKLLSYCRLA